MTPPLLAAAVLAWACEVSWASHSYKDIVPTYCHTTKDWGSLPERPSGATGLLQVQAFIRHGARTQCSDEYCFEGEQAGSWDCTLHYLDNTVSDSDPAPKTPYFRIDYLRGRNGIAGNCMTGQLVETGFDMERNNGRRLREAYVEREELLPEALSSLGDDAVQQLLRLRSTDVPRTKQSGMALVSGLYPGNTTGKGQILTLHTLDHDKENMYMNEAVCPVVDDAAEEYLQGYARKDELLAECRKLKPSGKFDKASACFGYLGHVIDCLMSRICPTVPFSHHNVTLPDFFLADDAAHFKYLWQLVDEAQWGYFLRMVEVGGLASFVEEVHSAATQATAGALDEDGRPTPKFLLWSGHDTGPMEPMYAAFDLRKDGPYWPSFASLLILEVWNSTSGPMVRWVSNGEAVGAAVPFAEFSGKARSVIANGKHCDKKRANEEAEGTLLVEPTTGLGDVLSMVGEGSFRGSLLLGVAVGMVLMGAAWSVASRLRHAKPFAASPKASQQQDTHMDSLVSSP